MQRSKVHAASVRLDVPLYKRVEKIAEADCRSVAQLLRKIVTDFVEQAETDKSACRSSGCMMQPTAG
jgi:predicted transcriptional regulator